MMRNKSRLFVVSGPSGSGKGTIINKVLSDMQNLCFSISATTRPPREGEIDKVNYYFLTKAQFEEKIMEDDFLEYTKYCNHYYGTLKSEVLKKLEQGCNVILDIEVQGAMAIKSKFPEAIMVFIMPPSIEELKRRLLGRKTETEETINSRLEIAKEEIKLKDRYRYIIINDQIEKAITELKEIIKN